MRREVLVLEGMQTRIGSWSRLLMTLLIATAELAVSAHAQTFGPTLTLSNSSVYSEGNQVAVVSPNVYAVWSDAQANNRSPARFTRSTNGGASFSAPITVLSTGIQPFGPHVAAAGSNVYVARIARSKTNKPRQVYFRASNNNGASFGPEIQVTALTSGAEHAAMAAAGNNVYLLWSTSQQVFVSASTNAGASFSLPVNLSNTLSYNGDPTLRAIGSNVHVAWTEQISGVPEVFYSRSINNGASFSPPANMSNTPGLFSAFPALAVAGSNVYLAYREAEYRFTRSLDDGATFSIPVDVSFGRVDAHGIAAGPRMAATGSEVHYIWHSDETSAGNYDVYYRNSVDGGASFWPSTNLTNSALPSFGLVAAEGPNAYVVWTEANDIHIRNSGDSGANFAAAINLSANAGGSGAPAIAAQASPAGIHVIWNDSTPGNAEILYRFGSIP